MGGVLCRSREELALTHTCVLATCWPFADHVLTVPCAGVEGKSQLALTHTVTCFDPAEVFGEGGALAERCVFDLDGVPSSCRVTYVGPVPPARGLSVSAYNIPPVFKLGAKRRDLVSVAVCRCLSVGAR